MSENIIFPNKSRTVCFSGHRPEKLPDGGDRNSRTIIVLKSILYQTVLDCIEEGYKYFITGLARGVDLWAGEIVLELKARGENIKLIAAVPYKGHGKGFRGDEKFVYNNIMQKADEIVYVSESYNKGCFLHRDKYMADRSDKLVAVVSDYSSGTGFTVMYAKKNGLKIKKIDPSKLSDKITAISNSSEESENMIIRFFTEEDQD